MAVTFTDGTMQGKIKSIVYDGVPTGTVLSFAGKTAPTNYLLCNGQAVSRTAYADLFKVIGTTYGAGDGSSTFNLPNLVDRFVEGGSTSGATKSAGLPNIKGGAGVYLWTAENAGGAFSLMETTGNPLAGSLTRESSIKHSMGFNFDASKSNSIYGASNTVQPPAIVMQYIIKT